jgi:LCP family protein required for cell wall assembly
MPERWWSRAFKVVAVVISAFVFLGTSGAYGLLLHYDSALNRIDVFGNNYTGKSSGGAVNYLLVGTDSAEGLTKRQINEFNLGAGRLASGARSDTMILVHVSKKRDKAVLVSFPRDSYVTIPAYTDAQGHRHSSQHNKLNASFSFGGASLAIRTIETNTGLTINHYVQINVLGLANMVNAVGGVDVCVPTSVNDRDSGLRLAAGRHHVGGVTAVAYARIRHGLTGGSDLGRIKRQQALIGSLISQATRTGMLLRPDKLNGFINAAIKAVKVDKQLSRNDLFTLAQKLRHVDPKHVTLMTVPLAPTSHHPGLGSTVTWDPVLAPQLFDTIKRDLPVDGPASTANTVTVAPSSISLHVYNGTGTTGLGRRAANDLGAVGFNIIGTPTSRGTSTKTTLVRYGPSRADSAKTLAAAVPGAQLQQVTSLGRQIELVVGSNYKGAVRVTVKPKPSASPSRVQTRTAADNPCS